MQDLRLICICKQKTFLTVLSINSSQKDKALAVKTSKPNFVTFFIACLLSCEISLFVTAANREGILLATYPSLASDIHWKDIHCLSCQSKRAKNTIHYFSIY